MGLRISRRPFLYSSHLIIEVLDKRKGTGLPIPIFHKAEAAFICANNTFLIVSQFAHPKKHLNGSNLFNSVESFRNRFIHGFQIHIFIIHGMIHSVISDVQIVFL